MKRVRVELTDGRWFIVQKSLLCRAEVPLLVRTIEEAARSASGEFVEVGVARGLTTAIVLRVLNMIGHARQVAAVDVDVAAGEWLERNARPYEGGCGLRFLHASSLAVAAARMQVDSVAWVLIDGCHCRECVLADLRAWAPLVSPRGYLLAHDTTPGGPTKATLCYRTNPPSERPVDVAGALAEWVAEPGWSFKPAGMVESLKPPVPGLRAFRRRA